VHSLELLNVRDCLQIQRCLFFHLEMFARVKLLVALDCLLVGHCVWLVRLVVQAPGILEEYRKEEVANLLVGDLFQLRNRLMPHVKLFFLSGYPLPMLLELLLKTVVLLFEGVDQSIHDFAHVSIREGPVVFELNE
jgi:hypothetical protein